MSKANFIRPDLINSNVYEAPYDNSSQRMHMNELPWSRLKDVNTPLNYYPDPQEELRLQKTLASIYRVAEDQLIVTRGSDEGIDLLMRLFLRPRLDCILQCPPTFSMYTFFATLQQGEILNCALDSNFEVTVDAIKSCWQSQCKLIVLCRPNNPTGNCLSLSFVADLCDTFRGRSIIVVDEAYIEFSGLESASCLINKFDNLIVLRTLSKAYGLAGLRIGSILAQRSLIQSLKAISSPYRFSNIIINLAIQSLSDTQWFQHRIASIQRERNKLQLALKKCRWINHVYPSLANFILVKTSFALALKEWAFEHGIALRQYPNNPLLQSCLRISVGDTQQNTFLLDTLNSWSGV